MTYVKINGTIYPAIIEGMVIDHEWGNRESKTITIEMAYADAIALFVNGLAWSILMDVEQEQDDSSIVTVQEEYDNSEYSMAGSITDNRDGTLAVKMGKPTQIEMLEAQYANAITEEELETAYVEGVNSL